jgi:iron-sulfur cluster repair protein YtfE (RIC family)
VIDTGEMLVIHTMFRTRLGELPGLVRAVPEADRRRADAVSDHLRLVLALLHAHHTAEDAMLWPLLVERAPDETAAMVELMEKQHDSVDRLTGEVRAADAAWRDRPGPAARDRLAGLVEDLAVTLDEHLEAEERDVLPLVARTVTAEEWARVGKGGDHKFPPRQMLLAFELLAATGDPVVVTRMRREIPAPIRPLISVLGPRLLRREHQRMLGR